MTQHQLIIDQVKLGKKGQFTIPKKIRDEDQFREDDLFMVTHLSGGEILLRKVTVQTPEDRLLEIIRGFPSFDARAAWREVQEERRKEHR